MRNVLIAAASLTLMGATACNNAQPQFSNAEPISCDVARDYVEAVISKPGHGPLAFSADDEQLLPEKIGNTPWITNAKGDPASPPPSELLKKLQKQGTRSAIPQCPGIRKVLNDLRIPYGKEPVEITAADALPDLYDRTAYGLTLPVVSADGKQALLLSSNVSGPLAGGGFIQFLERQPNGKWKVIAFTSRWIS